MATKAELEAQLAAYQAGSPGGGAVVVAPSVSFELNGQPLASKEKPYGHTVYGTIVIAGVKFRVSCNLFDIVAEKTRKALK